MTESPDPYAAHTSTRHWICVCIQSNSNMGCEGCTSDLSLELWPAQYTPTGMTQTHTLCELCQMCLDCINAELQVCNSTSSTAIGNCISPKGNPSTHQVLYRKSMSDLQSWTRRLAAVLLRNQDNSVMHLSHTSRMFSCGCLCAS